MTAPPEIHQTPFLQDLAVIMMVAGVVTIIFHRLRQPVVLGYILAGVLIGPNVFARPLVQEEATIRTLSELGVVFVLFSLGLEFSLRKLKAVGPSAFLAGVIEIPLMFWLGYTVGRMFNWDSMDAVFLGGMLSISSTTLIVKTLSEFGRTREKFAQLIFGILIVEDILAIVIIALLSGFAMSGPPEPGAVLITFAKLAAFMAIVGVVGLLTVPRLLGFVGSFKRDEMLLVTVLAICFGFSLLALKLGYSVALGAFVIGAVIAEAREIGRIEILIRPLRDMFSAVFFVSIGLLFNPRDVLVYWFPILICTLAVVFGKTISCGFGSFVAGNDNRTSMRTGLGLAQIGEFSFIIATLGMTLGVTSSFLYPIAVSVSVVTALLSPYLIRNSDSMVNWFDAKAPGRLLDYLKSYTEWISQLHAARRRNLAMRLVRKWILQMVLNVLLMTGIFLLVAYLGKSQQEILTKWGLGILTTNSFLWLIAAVLCLPFLIATLRKLQAFGMLIADMSVDAHVAGTRTTLFRGIISQTIPMAGAVVVALVVVLLSSTILPPTNVLFVLLGLVALMGFFLWRLFVRIYSMGQISLAEQFAQPPPTRREFETRVDNLLREAKLKMVLLDESSQYSGKLIKDLALRTQTGASIVVIERGDKRIINPLPDESLEPGDHLLLLGNEQQVNAAEVYLTSR